MAGKGWVARDVDEKTQKSPMDNLPRKFPSSIVWCPIPVLTWICPIIGHLGVAYSDGTVCDFQGPYHVSEAGHLAFGEVTRFIPINIDSSKISKWDEDVKKANCEYNKRMHNLCCDNCHSHVAMALNDFRLYGIGWWNMVVLALWMFFAGRFVSVGGFVKQFLPFLTAMVLILLL